MVLIDDDDGYDNFCKIIEIPFPFMFVTVSLSLDPTHLILINKPQNVTSLRRDG
jgi:hypothetical protein